MLDKKKPYGQVFGAPGIVFEQDGKFFNAKGEEAVFVDPEVEKPEEPEEPASKPAKRSRKKPESSDETPSV